MALPNLSSLSTSPRLQKTLSESLRDAHNELREGEQNVQIGRQDASSLTLLRDQLMRRLAGFENYIASLAAHRQFDPFLTSTNLKQNPNGLVESTAAHTIVDMTSAKVRPSTLATVMRTTLLLSLYSEAETGIMADTLAALGEIFVGQLTSLLIARRDGDAAFLEELELAQCGEPVGHVAQSVHAHVTSLLAKIVERHTASTDGSMQRVLEFAQCTAPRNVLELGAAGLIRLKNA